MTHLDDIAKEANEIAHEKGWYQDGTRNIGEVVALMHSELSEALEEWRNGRMQVWVDSSKPSVAIKPEGFYVELADCVIRIAETCYEHGISLEAVIEQKMAYNRTRPYRHGGKLA